MKILPGKDAELLALLGDTAAKVQEAEPDTLVYMFFRSKKDPQELLVFEIYKTNEARDAHVQSAILDEVRPKLPGLIDMASFKAEHTDPVLFGFMRD